jgi:hypothetical protein
MALKLSLSSLGRPSTSIATIPSASLCGVHRARCWLIWQAGPPRKGLGLCHGTAGNGYAFLKLFRRSGDQRWLYRARGFAMHAIEQHRRDTTKYGQRRYPLWTGDPGLAIFLSNCIAGTDRFPTMDNFFGP